VQFDKGTYCFGHVFKQSRVKYMTITRSTWTLSSVVTNSSKTESYHNTTLRLQLWCWAPLDIVAYA